MRQFVQSGCKKLTKAPSLQYAGITGVRLQDLKCDNEFHRFPKPGIEKSIDNWIKTGVTIK